MKQKLALTLAVSTIATAAMAGPLEDQIRFRQSAYSFLGWNAGKIKAQTGDHPETFNKEQVIAAANAIAAVANTDLLSLYTPGSDKGVGWKPTRLKADYFDKQEQIKEIQASFIKEANGLQEIAEDGDVAAIKAQFGKVGATCKSCHDLIKIKE